MPNQRVSKTRAAAKGRKAVGGMRKTGMSTNLKLTYGLLGVVLFVIAAVVVFAKTDSPAPADPAAVQASMVRDNSHRLDTAADGKVTVVEFLDFECEVCGAAYPGVEQLRKDYAGKITYVVRYFPLPGHLNSGNAAAAAQAAANQGKFEAMYHKLFETQTSWGDQQVDHTKTFEGFARDLGLDMDRYLADVAAAATAERVELDRNDGVAAGVRGTPTFFVNGQRLEGQPTYDNLKAAVDAALAG